MTNNNSHKTSNTINNAGRSINRVKINMNEGSITGNIIDGEIDLGYPTCEPYIYWFFCASDLLYLYALC